MAESLGNLIYKALTNTQTTPTNETLANELTNAFATFISSAKGTTVEKGTIPSGIYEGVGTLQSVECDKVGCSTLILECCNLLNSITTGGDAIFSSCLASAIFTLCINGKFKYTSVGAVTQGTTSTPISGTSVGNLTINQTLIDTSLKTMFSLFTVLPNESIESYNARLEIETKYKDTDESFANKFADILKPILEVGKISTKGEYLLEGSVGDGVLLFDTVEEKV